MLLLINFLYAFFTISIYTATFRNPWTFTMRSLCTSKLFSIACHTLVIPLKLFHLTLNRINYCHCFAYFTNWLISSYNLLNHTTQPIFILFANLLTISLTFIFESLNDRKLHERPQHQSSTTPLATAFQSQIPSTLYSLLSITASFGSNIPNSLGSHGL